MYTTHGNLNERSTRSELASSCTPHKTRVLNSRLSPSVGHCIIGKPEDPLGFGTRRTDAVTWETRLATPLHRVEMRDAAQDGTAMEDQLFIQRGGKRAICSCPLNMGIDRSFRMIIEASANVLPSRYSHQLSRVQSGGERVDCAG
ncbi:hypothetical protein N7466_000304 [Penicillium verhagenii]|uniref:uncharacterized protein n=1 Tax=Penicillium verhagenii TaxID=1562060 RepID=UPI002545B767|nr:uncharacterized protein N7466_000304 [Penicillium verhagenii]KAJ5947289.1 hypothetical protein N7466_000304 [Penicillium verhagenii]